ncbi:hypothetical protein BGX38DRAFT_310582 [Terfezia claveryi]|nr:hypothetical protein BGX38DRAFT_310582 [Terfezia claveryi]
MATTHTDLPHPNKPLGQHCSALVNGTLYTFTKDAFQSLHLEKGGKWEELPLLFGTQGAVCVHAHQDTPKEALYIIGGTLPNATMVPENEYKGIQKYTFKTRKWEVILVADPIAYNMTNHGAVFLKDTKEILLFSGTRWPDEWTPSAMTFLINTAPPYIITAVSAASAPPLLAPIVLPWGNDSALIVGGSATNTNLITYSPRGEWRDLGIQLKEGLPVRESGATLVNGDDGSRMLLTFDMSTLPVKFSRTKVKEPSGSSGGTKGLTEANWPTYNGTYAPQKVETNFALSADAGMMVYSGGDSLCIFNTEKNLWEDITSIFSQQDGVDVVSNGKGDDGLKELPSPTPTETPAPATPGRKQSNIQLLFIILAAILGAFVILGIALYYLRRYKRGRKATGLGRSNTTRSKMSFQDRGLGFMKEAGAMDDLPSPQEPQRGSGWSKYFSGGSATNLVNLPSRTYSTGTRRSSIYDSNFLATYPNGPLDPLRAGSLGGRPAASVHSAGLELDLPGATLNVNPQHFSANRRVSNGSMSSLGASSYSSGIPESILEKSIWDPTGNGGSRTGGMVGSSTGRYGEVQNSLRGWAVVTDNRVASSVYPESAVTVYPDGYGYGNPDNSRANRGVSRNESVGPIDSQNDISWFNLKV